MVVAGSSQALVSHDFTDRERLVQPRELRLRATPISRPIEPEEPLEAPPVEAITIRLAREGIVDLRRYADPDLAALLCERARHLSRADRALIECVFRDGRSLSEVARLRAPGDDQTVKIESVRLEARRLARRLKAIVRRMTSPLFVFVALRLERVAEMGATGAWPVERCRVAKRVLLHGEPVLGVAASMGLKAHVVRAHLRAVEALHAGAAS